MVERSRVLCCSKGSPQFESSSPQYFFSKMDFKNNSGVHRPIVSAKIDVRACEQTHVRERTKKISVNASNFEEQLHSKQVKFWGMDTHTLISLKKTWSAVKREYKIAQSEEVDIKGKEERGKEDLLNTCKPCKMNHCFELKM